jgi:hypothetical protein
MLWIFVALACSSEGDAPGSGVIESGSDTATGVDDTATGTDVDVDGYDATVDCDDNDSDVHPGATETCGNGRDDNCNGRPDGCDWSGEYVLEGTELTATDDYSQLGTALSVCDANGDGIDDVIVSAPGDAFITGGVFVFYGPIDEDRDVKDADYALMGAGPTLYTGLTVDCRGDIDGDALPDIIVGESGSPGDPGTAYVAAGMGTGRASLADEASRAWVGSAEGDLLGWQLVAIDVGGDATEELAVSTGPWKWWRSAIPYGAAYIFEDAGPGIHGTEDAAAYIYGDDGNILDTTVGNAGDIDGDGVEELVLTGSDPVVDAVLVFRAPLSGAIPKSDADVEIVGGPHGAVSWGGIGHADLDDDGRDDLFVGNSRQDVYVGEVYAFFELLDGDTTTAAADLHILGSDEHYGAGSDVTSPGDVDGDGRADLLIGAANTATVYLQYGGEGGLYSLAKDAQASWQSGYWYGHDGATVAAGDVTGDGIGEFLIAAPDDGLANGTVTILSSFQL